MALAVGSVDSLVHFRAFLDSRIGPRSVVEYSGASWDKPDPLVRNRVSFAGQGESPRISLVSIRFAPAARVRGVPGQTARPPGFVVMRFHAEKDISR